ncbi:hypothetical protein A3Q56_06633, partial [Intoshia linei]
MFSTVISRWISNLFTNSLYQSIIEVECLIYTKCPSKINIRNKCYPLDLFCTKDVMSQSIVSFHQIESFYDIATKLLNNYHAAYPVIFDYDCQIKNIFRGHEILYVLTHQSIIDQIIIKGKIIKPNIIYEENLVKNNHLTSNPLPYHLPINPISAIFNMFNPNNLYIFIRGVPKFDKSSHNSGKFEEKDFSINDKIKLIKLFDEYSNRSQKHLATKHSILIALINKSLKNREEILTCNNLNLNQKRQPCL